MWLRYEWLNADHTLVRVTRGILWWKRIALLERDPKGSPIPKGRNQAVNWRHTMTKAWASIELDAALDAERSWFEATRATATEIPAARTVPPATRTDVDAN